MGVEAPRPCSALTRSGKPCGGFATKDGDTCISHSPEGEAIRAKATLASAQARSRKVKDREEAIEASKLSLTQALAVAAGKRQADIIAALVQRAVDGDMRAQTILWERIEGKVADQLITQAGDPFHMDEAELAAWLRESTGPSAKQAEGQQ